MARPTKSVAMISGHISKEEREVKSDGVVEEDEPVFNEAYEKEKQWLDVRVWLMKNK